VRRWLLIFEDSHWRSLRPLTDLVPVPSLVFGSSNLAARWARATRLPVLAVLTRPGLSARPLGPHEAGSPERGDTVVVANAAALPGPWVERALEDGPGVLFSAGGRVAAALVEHSKLQPALARGGNLETFLLGAGLESQPIEARMITYPWELIGWNAEAIAADLADEPGAIFGHVHPRAAVVEPRRVTVEPGARVDPLAVLDGRAGPVWIGPRAEVLAQTVVVGPCAVGAGTQLLGGVIGRSTFGPQCRVAGEVEECVWQGYANKRHHGFVGHSAIGEWVNLGALTTTSDLKNNYGVVRMHVEGRTVDSGTRKIGSLVGAHVKAGIGTLLPTGAWIGVGSNLFGGGRFVPKVVPPFSWWDGERFEEHRLEAFLETARAAMGRRERSLPAAEEETLRRWFEATAEERAASFGAAAGRAGR